MVIRPCLIAQCVLFSQCSQCASVLAVCVGLTMND